VNTLACIAGRVDVLSGLTGCAKTRVMILSASPQRVTLDSRHTLSDPQSLVALPEAEGQAILAVSPATVSGHDKVSFLSRVVLASQNPAPAKKENSPVCRVGATLEQTWMKL